MSLRDLPPFLLILFLLPYVVVLLSGHFDGTRAERDKLKIEDYAKENTVSGYEWWIVVRNEGVLERMDLETYVCGATAAVLPANSETEFIKAQMILVRTNIVRELLEETEYLTNPDVFSETLSEQYTSIDTWAKTASREKDRAIARLYEAAKETKGKILTYEGMPVEASYHAVSNGTTRAGREVLGEEIPYLISVSCPDDRYAQDYLCRKECKEELWEVGKVEILERDSAGYVLRVRMEEEIVTGESFRRQYALHSADFTITKGKEGWVVTTKGCGHGLGMSQNTANQMAKKGMKCEEILSKFFPGTECKIFE